MVDKICKILELLKKSRPLVHCITNPISINQCANAILAVGAKPIMAEHPREVLEITDTADALMVNVGNITDARMESIMLSTVRAKEKGIPVLLDAVGTACSRLRREYVLDLLHKSTPCVIKGNYSEIEALYDVNYIFAGVDAEPSFCEDSITKAAIVLARKYKTVIFATGKTDVITDGKRVVYVKNGTPLLASVTGTGCMLGALCAAFMTSENPLNASVAAGCYFGICGELSQTDCGNGSFGVSLMDRISNLGREDVGKYLKMEERQVE